MFVFSLVKVTAKAQLKNTVATYSLAGEVRGPCSTPCQPPGGPLVSGVTITFTRVSGTGSIPLPVQTDGGKWSQTGFEEGTVYRITPSNEGSSFLPAFQDVNTASNQIFFSSYPSYTVSGRVTLNGVGVSEVIINIMGPNSPTIPQLSYISQTDINGNWSIPGIRAGIVFYTIFPAKSGYVFSPCPQTFLTASNQLNFEASQPTLTVVSSADFNYRPGFCSYPSVAQDSIVSAFGSNLAATTQTATSLPLPTELAGTAVKIKDSAGIERDAPLFFVSPTQINFQVPPDTSFQFPSSTASITVVRNGSVVNQGNVNITDFQPTIFTADATGEGLPAAVVYRLRADGSDSYEPLSRFDTAQNKFVAVSIDFGAETDQVFLVLFGTGGQTSLQSYEATIGGTPAQVTYVGRQPSYVGLIQTNVLMPRSLIGRGEVEVRLRAIGREANPVTINIR